jgi:sulfite oxidase
MMSPIDRVRRRLKAVRVGKEGSFRVWKEAPYNGEPAPGELCSSLVTPLERFYVRNHGPIPAVDLREYRLRVEGLVEHPLVLSLEELTARFETIAVAAVLDCAGNRRSQLLAVREIPGEIAWGDGAIGNAVWRGVRLGDVLREAKPAAEARYACFLGLDEADRAEAGVRFGGSIPLAKALSPETLLAYEMNGEPLRPEHGFPLRVVVPGYVGARCVKWLSAITLEREPSDNYFQRRSYRLFPPGVREGDIDWERGLMLGELAVNSAICRPGDGEVLPTGPVILEGWALAGGGRLVERVDVSADGGERWVQAELRGERDPWQWRLWRAELELAAGEHELVARAWDSAASTQPEDPSKLWNLKGYANNAWPRARVRVA